VAPDDLAGHSGDGRAFCKFVTEWTLALVLLLGVSPVIVLLALIVRATTPGPAIYSQVRLGLRGRTFRIYKFRTMRVDAEAQTGPVWAARNDSRVTRVGRILRETHLDELPQLWNVLRGDMALIGPRPERPEIAQRIATGVPNYMDRLSVRPGITGLAQMLLPADDPDASDYAGVRLKLAYDLAYVRQACIVLDFKILLSTACHFFTAALSTAHSGTRRLVAAAAGVVDPASHTGGTTDELAELLIA
jgi:lipopolysaccharide/colanic/teichoic acid biosynthesis glycosyltransferase